MRFILSSVGYKEIQVLLRRVRPADTTLWRCPSIEFSCQSSSQPQLCCWLSLLDCHCQRAMRCVRSMLGLLHIRRVPFIGLRCHSSNYPSRSSFTHHIRADIHPGLGPATAEFLRLTYFKVREDLNIFPGRTVYNIRRELGLHRI